FPGVRVIRRDEDIACVGALLETDGRVIGIFHETEVTIPTRTATVQDAAGVDEWNGRQCFDSTDFDAEEIFAGAFVDDRPFGAEALGVEVVCLDVFAPDAVVPFGRQAVLGNDALPGFFRWIDGREQISAKQKRLEALFNPPVPVGSITLLAAGMVARGD